MTTSFRIRSRKRRPLPQGVPARGKWWGILPVLNRSWTYPARLVRLTGLVRLRRSTRPFFTTLRGLLDRDQEVTLGHLIQHAGEQTYGLLILLLALPSLVPGLNLGAAPVGGSAIMALGFQMMRGVPRPTLPKRLLDQPLHKGKVKESLAAFERTLLRIAPRRRIHRDLNRKWAGGLVFFMALLLALPLPLAFGNMAPALTLCILGAALLEEQSLWAWLGALCSLGVIIYFALSFNLILKACLGGWHVLRHHLF